jgi:hypothetical protein
MGKLKQSDLDSLELCDDKPYGAQSGRKGASTHACHRSNVCSVISVFLRAGWSLGGVFPHYLKYADHGDHAVGRAVLGSDDFSADWAMLPPEFDPDELGNIPFVSIIPNYSLMSNTMQNAMRHLLPLVVLHREWLVNTCSSKDKLFESNFWTNRYQESLEPVILCPVPFKRERTLRTSVLSTYYSCEVTTNNDIMNSYGRNFQL